MSAKVTDEDGTIQEITLESLHHRVSNLENIKVKNGTEKIMPVSQCIGEIWESTEILRDVNKMWKVFKKYRRVIALAGVIIAGLWYKVDIAMFVIKLFGI